MKPIGFFSVIITNFVKPKYLFETFENLLLHTIPYKLLLVIQLDFNHQKLTNNVKKIAGYVIIKYSQPRTKSKPDLSEARPSERQY